MNMCYGLTVYSKSVIKETKLAIIYQVGNRRDIVIDQFTLRFIYVKDANTAHIIQLRWHFYKGEDMRFIRFLFRQTLALILVLGKETCFYTLQNAYISSTFNN